MAVFADEDVEEDVPLGRPPFDEEAFKPLRLSDKPRRALFSATEAAFDEAVEFRAEGGLESGFGFSRLGDELEEVLVLEIETKGRGAVAPGVQPASFDLETMSSTGVGG